MRENENSVFETLDGVAGWHVTQTGSQIVAFLVHQEHFGFYYCVRGNETNGNIFVIKKALNFKGPYFGDLWKKYETNVIVALSSSGSFLVLVILTGLTYHFRYRGDDVSDDDVKKTEGSRIEVGDDHVNIGEPERRGDLLVWNTQHHSNQAYEADAE